MALFPRLVDAELSELAVALPNGAAAVYEDFDLGAINATLGVMAAEFDIEVVFPTLALAHLANTETIIASATCDSDVAFGSPRNLNSNFLIVTGATGTDPALSVNARFRVPMNCERYLRITFTKTGAGNCSTDLATIKFMF